MKKRLAAGEGPQLRRALGLPEPGPASGPAVADGKLDDAVADGSLDDEATSSNATSSNDPKASMPSPLVPRPPPYPPTLPPPLKKVRLAAVSKMQGAQKPISTCVKSGPPPPTPLAIGEPPRSAVAEEKPSSAVATKPSSAVAEVHGYCGRIDWEAPTPKRPK